MRIAVHFTSGQWAIDPDPAQVRIGEPIEWLINASGTQLPNLLLWTIYFNERSPFGPAISRFTVTTLRAPSDHLGIIGPVYAAVPDDYKYGVRVQDADSQKTVGDDDPRLIVTP